MAPLRVAVVCRESPVGCPSRVAGSGPSDKTLLVVWSTALTMPLPSGVIAIATHHQAHDVCPVDGRLVVALDTGFLVLELGSLAIT
jgi:hypothetical protein